MNEKKEILYFAYGSNLHAAQMKERCPGMRNGTAAHLSRWRLAERFYADIEKSEDDCVHGVLYTITRSDLENLDRYEGYPEEYERVEVLVTECSGILRKAWVYVMTEPYRTALAGKPFPERYRRVCSEGAEYWGIPNAFRCGENGAEPTCRTLISGAPGDLTVTEGMAMLLEYIDSGAPLPRAASLWSGARVVITLKKQNIKGDFGFYPAPFELSTCHGAELSWLFNDLRDIFTSGKVLNSCNKFDFYNALASAAESVLQKDPETDARTLCRAVLLKAQTFFDELKER